MFENLNGAQLAAKRIQRAYDLKASLANELVARAAGYRDHHHLRTAIGAGSPPVTPDGPPAMFMAYVAGRTEITPEALFLAIRPADDTGKLSALADRHPLTRGYGQLLESAQRLAGDAFEIWANEDGYGIDAGGRQIGAEARRMARKYAEGVQEAFQSIFGTESMPCSLYDSHRLRLDESGLLVEELPGEPLKGHSSITVGRRVVVPYGSRMVSEIVLHGVHGMPADADQLNVWRNRHSPYDMDVQRVDAVRDDGVFTYYQVDHDDVTRLNHLRRYDFDDIQMDPEAKHVSAPLLATVDHIYRRYRLEDEFEHLLGDPGQGSGATRLDVARAVAFIQTYGVDVPNELRIAWISHRAGPPSWGPGVGLVSVRQMDDGPTELETMSGPHGVIIMRDTSVDADAPPLIAMTPSGQWTYRGIEMGEHLDGLQEALVAAWD